MTTSKDLLIVTMDMPSHLPVERGDLSLALAGAEAVDLLAAGAIRVETDRIVPGTPRRALGDPLLDEAAAAVVREKPYEVVDAWLWRRGRGLAQSYLDAMEAAGLLARESWRRWLVVRNSRLMLLDSAERRRAHHRWNADEPVLAGLATTIGVTDHRAEEESPQVGDAGAGDLGADDAPAGDTGVAAVLSAVAEAVAELAAERERRDGRLLDAAADNVRRGY
ncbi:GOLPH3/VPS74 family protein [Actinacidiphila acidipaludis]|uniref:GPP34 family phosphoprotein n=1 Tax=Actinacidiphila acidipaludis TaxID=2873382 RepID=A0ABS7Q938_9ACTN|nr:GPP34 family phosphoprotein [Streptomyces acidipaludis]MBY8878955.1 GPP34 family phosphoprotein [Streptomyces acidipaludis]